MMNLLIMGEIEHKEIARRVQSSGNVLQLVVTEILAEVNKEHSNDAGERDRNV